MRAATAAATAGVAATAAETEGRALDCRAFREVPMSAYELAELNIAVMKEPLDSPSMADFVAALDRINAIADVAPGFVWRMQTEEGDATALRPLGDATLVNLSVWRDAAALEAYVYRSAHVEIMKRRKEWFERMKEAWVVLWWVPRGHRPEIGEAIAKLERLRAEGPTAEAFTFRKAFPPPDAETRTAPFALGGECPAT